MVFWTIGGDTFAPSPLERSCVGVASITVTDANEWHPFLRWLGALSINGALSFDGDCLFRVCGGRSIKVAASGFGEEGQEGEKAMLRLMLVTAVASHSCDDTLLSECQARGSARLTTFDSPHQPNLLCAVPTLLTQFPGKKMTT